MLQFRKMRKYIQQESLEIGGGDCDITNLIFEDIVDSITFSCEYYMDNYLNKDGYISQERYKHLHKVVKHHVWSLLNAFWALWNVQTVHTVPY